MFTMENNSMGGGEVEVDLTVEKDDGVFLGLVINSPDGDEIVDLFTTDRTQIVQFFEDVAYAKVQYERLTGLTV